MASRSSRCTARSTGTGRFPKASSRHDESLLECARREVWEEGGVSPAVGCYLGRISYTKWRQPAQGGGLLGDAGRRRSHSHRPAEVDRIRWVDEPSLERPGRLHRRSGKLVAGMGEDWRRPADRILLTRHAKAGTRGRWGSDDSARPLSRTRHSSGREPSCGQLRWFDIDTIVTSPAARCTETVAPLARARGLLPEISEDLWEEAGRVRVEALLEGARPRARGSSAPTGPTLRKSSANWPAIRPPFVSRRGRPGSSTSPGKIWQPPTTWRPRASCPLWLVACGLSGGSLVRCSPSSIHHLTIHHPPSTIQTPSTI